MRQLALTVALASAALLPAAAQENRIDVVRPDAPALAAFGPSSVGVRTFTFTNPGQVNVLLAKAGQPNPTYDRPLTVEVWYPALLPAGTAARGEYRTTTRDAKIATTLVGRAVRDAPADRAGGARPLVILSHGYPGNRFLLSHLGENLASKGYVVASIDHTDSTYADQGAFGSTLLNRPIDQIFVLNEMAKLGAAAGPLSGIVDANRTALVGYSMGGYGVLNAIGAGLAPAAAKSPFGPPNELLAPRTVGNPAYPAPDPRVKAAVAIAPWGWNAGLWDAAGLAGIKIPVLFVAGGIDDVAGYAPGVRNLYEAAVNSDRLLLTFENANHNAAAPIPAPAEAGPVFSHYSDAVWDNVRMNNIAQHFLTAFLGQQLKGDAAMAPYLDLVENAKDGKWVVNAQGVPQAGHTYWKGFPERTAVGLRLEHRAPAR